MELLVLSPGTSANVLTNSGRYRLDIGNISLGVMLYSLLLGILLSSGCNSMHVTVLGTGMMRSSFRLGSTLESVA